MTYLKSHSDHPGRIGERLFFFIVITVAVLFALCIVGFGINVAHWFRKPPTPIEIPKNSVTLTQDQLSYNHDTDTPTTGA